MPINNITDQEVAKLKATRSSIEWNRVCDEIKNARGGEYPPDWWNRIMMTGLMAQIHDAWEEA